MLEAARAPVVAPVAHPEIPIDQRFGPELEREDLAEVSALLGSRLADREEADRALEAFILSDGGRSDRKIISLLYRRLRREQLPVEPLLHELRGARIQRID